MKQLLPPRGIEVPTEVVFDKGIQPVVRDTWVQLRALAWGALETPDITFDQLMDLTGKTRSTIYGHLQVLRDSGRLSWRSTGNLTFRVSFGNSVLESGQSENSDLPNICVPNKDSTEKKDTLAQSENLDSPKIRIDTKGLFVALAEVCRMIPSNKDWTTVPKTVRGRLNKAAKELADVGATPDQVRAFIAWWYANDWRGKQKQVPSPQDVVREWMVYMNHKSGGGNVSSKSDGNNEYLSRVAQRIADKRAQG